MLTIFIVCSSRERAGPSRLAPRARWRFEAHGLGDFLLDRTCRRLAACVERLRGEIARIGQRDLDELLQLARPRRHDDDPLPESDRLIDVMRDEHDLLPG